jgi:hypothetical protein
MRIILILFCFVYALMGVDQHSAVNIQTSMTGADMSSFGRVTPYQTQNIGNVFVNPASIGGIEYYQVSLATFQQSKQFDYRHVSFALPFGANTYGISYGSNITGGFYNTFKDKGVIYDIGEFSSGFEVLQFSVGSKLNEPFFMVDHFYYGVGINALVQVIGSKKRQPAYGIDLGVIGTSYFERSLLNRLDVGVSMINAVSTRLPEWSYDSQGKSQAQLVERQLFLGANMEILNYEWAVRTGAYFRNLRTYDYMFGLLYRVTHGLELRSSMVYDINQAHSFTYHFGVGLKLARVAGIGKHTYDMSVDYNYAMYPYPRTTDPTHTFSFTFFGQATDKRPVVTFPRKSFSTDKDYVSFKGNADRNAMINVYNNGELKSQVIANNNGKWRLDDFPIDLGYNTITFRSKSSLNDLSEPSLPLVVHYDLVAANVGTEVNIEGDRLKISVISDEMLKKAIISTKNGELEMKRETNHKYVGYVDLPEALTDESPFPENMASFSIVTFDRMGNRSMPQLVHVFVKPIFPRDKSVVYNDAITVLGHLSPDVERLYVNEKPVVTDKNNGFAVSLQLQYGKQVVKLSVETKNKQRITYYARLMCIQKFDDIPKFAKYRRDIQFLATLGYVSGKEDGLFHPEDEMTRRDVTLAIAKQKNLVPKDLDYDPYLDIKKDDPDAGLISAAIDEGIVYAFSDGTFRPKEKVSVADAFKMLNNSGVIDSDEIVVDKAPIKRYEFALFFKQVRRYDQRVQYLMDWSQGYDI